MSAPALLTDVFTFLCFLHADDIAAGVHRLLLPTALERLNAQLLMADSPEQIQAAGKHWSSERKTARICFLHFMSEAAGLIALTGRWLKPTPRVAMWLRASEPERAQQLFAAAFPSQPDRAHDALWQAYRLPGWRHPSPSLAFAPLLDILRQMRRDEPLKLATLLKLVPLGARDEKPEAILRGVLRYLAWFDVVEWSGRSAAQLTDGGAWLLRRPDAPALLSLPSPSLSYLAADGRTVRLQADWPALYELSQYTQLVSVQPKRVYRLDRARVQRALEHGATLPHLLQFLAGAAGRTLPKPVVALLESWAQEVNQVTLRRVTLLEVAEPELLTQLTGERRTRADIRRTLSPRAVVAREDHLPALVRRLERRGLVPRVEFPLFAGRSAARRFDQASLAYFYLALRLCHQLSDLIPSAYRAPYSLLLDLEKRLGERDRDLAAQLADEAAQHILNPPASRLLSTGDHVPGPVAETIALIEHAIQTGAPLEIVYYSPYRDQVTTRVVEPHRLEWRGCTPYLIAYCQFDGDERTFRVDRIRSISDQ